MLQHRSNQNDKLTDLGLCENLLLLLLYYIDIRQRSKILYLRDVNYILVGD